MTCTCHANPTEPFIHIPRGVFSLHPGNGRVGITDWSGAGLFSQAVTIHISLSFFHSLPLVFHPSVPISIPPCLSAHLSVYASSHPLPSFPGIQEVLTTTPAYPLEWNPGTPGTASSKSQVSLSHCPMSQHCFGVHCCPHLFPGCNVLVGGRITTYSSSWQREHPLLVLPVEGCCFAGGNKGPLC